MTLPPPASRQLVDSKTGVMRTEWDVRLRQMIEALNGLQVGVNVQPWDAQLTAIASLTPAADTAPYFTSVDTAALMSVTAAARSLLDDADAATMRGTLGLGSMAEQNASAVAITGGSITGITDVAVADGGTGASTAAGARTNLGLAIGTDVQAQDADLQALADNSTNGLWARTGAGAGAARTLAGTAGRITVANGDGVAGNPTIDVGADVYRAGGTDVAVADGGTGASTAAGARTNLGLDDVVRALTKQDVTASGASLVIDMANGWHVALTLSANVTSITVSNWPSSGKLGKLTLEITSTGAFTMSGWPGTTIWKNGVAPTITSGAGAKDTIVLTSIDGGTNFRGYIVAQNLS